jgi:fibronectin-binding autotransporter adhesin
LLVITNPTALINGVYPLITYTGSLLSGSGSSANLTIVGFSQANKSATLSDTLNPNEIDLVIADTASDAITWSGSGTDWDTIGSLNWFKGATPWAFTNGDLVTFDEIGVANPTVYLKAAVLPHSITVSNETADYTFADGTGTGGGKISGATVITKNGPATLLIETVNNNSGGLLINNGTVQIGDASSVPGDIGTGNVTNNGVLIFGPPSGDTRTVAAISGTGSLQKQGFGTTIASANNTYSGLTTISAGTLQIGNGGSTGTLGSGDVADNATLSFNRTGSLTVPNAISGTGSLSVNGGATITLTASNNYTGGTTVNAGKLILGNANAIAGLGNLTVQAAGTNDLNGNDLTVARLSSTLNAGGRIVNNGSGTNVLDINGSSSGDSSIVIADNDGSGGKIRLVKDGTSTQTFRAASTYSGGTVINAGAIQARSQNNAFGTATNVILNGGQLQNYASTLGYTIETWADSGLETSGNSTFTGALISTNTITSTIDGGTVTMSWGTANQMTGFTGRMLVQGNATASYFRWTSSPNGSAAANWDLEGNVSMTTSGGGYTIYLGSLEGASTSSLQGNSTTTYIIGGKNTNTTFSGTVGGSGAVNLVKAGTALLTLNGSVSAPGSTTVSNGVLALVEPVSLDTFSGVNVRAGGTLDVTGRSDTSLNLGNSIVQTLSGSGTVNGSVNEGINGIINPGDGIGTLNVSGTVTLAGTNIFELNRTNSASAATNDMISATGTITVNGGAIIVTNLGSDLITGDTFKLFNQPITGSGFTTVSLPVSNAVNTVQYVWQNNLASDGTIKLLQGASSLANYSTNITASVSGSTITISWPSTHLGWELAVQTNSTSIGLGKNWVTNYGTANVTSTNFTVDPQNGAVFYRLVHP